jgi:hypothetical protein
VNIRLLLPLSSVNFIDGRCEALTSTDDVSSALVSQQFVLLLEIIVMSGIGVLTFGYI